MKLVLVTLALNVVASRAFLSPMWVRPSASPRGISSKALMMTTTLPTPVAQEVVGSPSLMRKMEWRPEGNNNWVWQGHQINYAVMGEEDAPPLLLIHGFGASSFHWRYNLPALADQGYRVYAIDLLGFGLSEKPIIGYTADTWRDQALDFIREVIKKPTVVAGNSLGGYAALAAASSGGPGLVKGCVLINAAGRFDPSEGAQEGGAWKEVKTNEGGLWEQFKAFMQKTLITASFYYTKQPLRIKQVLQQVYSVNPGTVDDELVESIRFPADNPNAPEVFFRVITKGGRLPSTFNDMLARLKVPLLLLWGEKDPWIQSITADRIQELYVDAKRVSIDAGHCPHDEAPQAVNSAMLEWLADCVEWEI